MLIKFVVEAKDGARMDFVVDTEKDKRFYNDFLNACLIDGKTVSLSKTDKDVKPSTEVKK